MAENARVQGAVLFDLQQGNTAGGNGAQLRYESEDLDLTTVTWRDHQGVVAHINGEVDVLLIVIAGTGDVTVGSTTYALVAGQALLIPKGTERAIRATDDHFSYLSVHRRRRGLWPTVRGEPA